MSSSFVPLSARQIGGSSGQSVKRKWRESSSSASYDGPTRTIENSRVGFPQPLPRLPIQTTAVTTVSEEQLVIWKSCRDESTAIIDEEGLDFKEIGIYMRRGAGESQPSPTLLITLRNEMNHDIAKSALVTIGHMLHEKHVRNLRVEIADRYAYQTENIYPINSDHCLVKLWPRKIRGLVLNLLEFVTFSELGVYEYGFTAKTAVPTIMITVKDPSYNIRDDLKSAIVQVCAANGAPNMRVAVVYEDVRMHEEHAFEHLQGYKQGLQALVQRPGMGHSIGVDDMGAGTLGGYIILVDDENQSRTHAFLTCCNVFRPFLKHVSLASDAGTAAYGEWPKNTPQAGEVHSPSRRHINDFSDRCQKTIDEGSKILDELTVKEDLDCLSETQKKILAKRRSDRRYLESQIRANENFLQQGREVYGHAKIASGYQTTQDHDLIHTHTLDWAIGVPSGERRGVNSLPIQEETDKIEETAFPLIGTTCDTIEVSTDYKDQRLFKRGARTGLTDGVYNAIEAVVDITLPDGTIRRTSEHTIVAQTFASKPFSKNGDSGSWVLNSSGCWIGLLWGGCGDARAYFTPVGLVIADIEARTGWRVELP